MSFHSNLPPGVCATDFDPIYSGQIGCDMCSSDAFSENEFINRHGESLLICDDCAERIEAVDA